jgi:hypothetical protein
MVDLPRCLATDDTASLRRVVGRTALAVLWCLWLAAPLPAQQPPVHYWHQGAMPPGAIGSLRLQQGGPLPGFFQPVKIKAPPGALVSLAQEGTFGVAEKAPVTAGLLIGQVYRLRVMNIPFQEGMEVFPTLEVIDRLCAPPGQEHRFPIEIELTREDLELALEGKFVTRVIYLEDPQLALPIRGGDGEQQWFEVGPGRDPLAVADQFGRPVAILRLGARLPDLSRGLDMDFLFGCPPLVRYEPPGDAPEGPAAQEASQLRQASQKGLWKE